jgi:hypothetical protein
VFHVQADINPQDNAVAPVDQQPPVLSPVEPIPEETPAIGTFATGLTNHQPRPWSGKQMVGARRSGGLSRVDSLPKETPAIGTFATGLTNHQPRPWSGKQMVGERRERGKR